MFDIFLDVPIIFEDDIFDLIDRLKNLNSLIKLSKRILKLHRKRLKWLTQQLFEAEFLLTAEELSKLSTYTLLKNNREQCLAEVKPLLTVIITAKSTIRSLPLNRIKPFLNVR